jgi:glycine amidinotransferase/scyllo-inosamine-4-phosphate amidinotransferase 1
MKIFTKNEYSPLKQVIVGSAEQATWPTGDKEFDDSIARSTYDATLIPGALPDNVVQEALEDVDKLVQTLEREGIIVYRPIISKPGWSYSARDILLTAGEHLIECPTPFSSRANEAEQYPFLDTLECKRTKAPRPESKDDPMFDAANVLKLDDKLLYSITHSANQAGAEWLQQVVGTDFEVIAWKGVEDKVTHIDSTILSLNKDTILVNGSRINDDNLPSFMKNYKQIRVDDTVPRQFEHFPLASKWIGLNVLSLSPDTVIVDEIQTAMIEQLRQNGFNVIALPLRQSRTLGGGFHCLTCDIERED